MLLLCVDKTTRQIANRYQRDYMIIGGKNPTYLGALRGGGGKITAVINI